MRDIVSWSSTARPTDVTVISKWSSVVDLVEPGKRLSWVIVIQAVEETLQCALYIYSVIAIFSDKIIKYISDLINALFVHSKNGVFVPEVTHITSIN